MPQTLTIILLLLFALPASAQETGESEPETAAVEADALPPSDDDEAAAENGGADAPEEEPDDSDLDLQTYEEDDDDFVPTEEIPADEPIPFPSNI